MDREKERSCIMSLNLQYNVSVNKLIGCPSGMIEDWSKRWKTTLNSQLRYQIMRSAIFRLTRRSMQACQLTFPNPSPLIAPDTDS